MSISRHRFVHTGFLGPMLPQIQNGKRHAAHVVPERADKPPHRNKFVPDLAAVLKARNITLPPAPDHPDDEYPAEPEIKIAPDIRKVDLGVPASVRSLTRHTVAASNYEFTGSGGHTLLIDIVTVPSAKVRNGTKGSLNLASASNDSAIMLKQGASATILKTDGQVFFRPDDKDSRLYRR